VLGQVVGGEPVVLVGNSLGGYNCLKAGVEHPNLVRAVALLNSAGRFEEVKAEVEAQVEAALPQDASTEETREILREVLLAPEMAARVFSALQRCLTHLACKRHSCTPNSCI
jgi:pimeloyl-ACP methyl ester carboxylesterase